MQMFYKPNVQKVRQKDYFMVHVLFPAMRDFIPRNDFRFVCFLQRFFKTAERFALFCAI